MNLTNRINLLAATRGGQALDERRVFRGSQTLLRGGEQLALPQGFGMEPKSREDAGAEDAVVAGLQFLVLAARELTPDNGAGLQLHGEVFADAGSAVEVELDAEVAGEAGSAYFDDEFRCASGVLSGFRGLATEFRQDPKENVGLRSVFGAHDPSAVDSSLAFGSFATVDAGPPGQVKVGGAVDVRDQRIQKNDAIDEFGTLEVRHRFPTADKLCAVEGVAFIKARLLHWLRLSRVLLGWLLFAGSLWAQTPLYLDLSGDWRRSPNDDVSLALAAPQVDDSQWPVVRLPLARRLSGTLSLWLRKTVALPPGVDRTRMMLTLGVLREQYSVYVNGQRIAMVGDFKSHAGDHLAQARSFLVPADVVPADVVGADVVGASDRLQIAVLIGSAPSSPQPARSPMRRVPGARTTTSPW